MTLDIAKFKEKLEAEKKILEENLAEVGRPNPNNKEDWEVTPIPGENDPEMHDEVADFLEDLEEREETEVELEQQLHQVNGALKRIEDGVYGTCKVCGKEIETERLEANPSATTCKEHRNQE